jgi:hypothetical protein
VPFLERCCAVFHFEGSQFAPQDGDEEVPASTGGFEETGVDALAFTLDEIENVFDQPVGRERYSMVCNAPLGLDQIPRCGGPEIGGRTGVWFRLESEEGFSASCPGLPGCWSQGETEAEALDNIRDAIREYLGAVTDTIHESNLREVEVSV